MKTYPYPFLAQNEGLNAFPRVRSLPMSSASSSWRDYDSADRRWEDEVRGASDSGPEDDPWGGSECSTDEEGAVEETPGDDFVRYMVGLVSSRTLNAREFCTAMHYAGEAGIAAAVPYGLNPQAASGHFSRKVDSALGMAEERGDLYELDIPSYNKNALTRSSITFEVLPAQEQLHADMETDTSLAEGLAEHVAGGAPRAYTEHPVVVGPVADGAPEGNPLPVALYFDGAPSSQVDSVPGFWLINLINGRRYLFCTLRKRTVCKCGCRGWCTLYSVFAMIHWSLAALAKGIFPSCRHDGTPFAGSDGRRAELSLRPMRRRAACVYVKGDWSELAGTVGLPSWQDSLRPCFCCCACGEDMHCPHGNSILNLRWACNGDGDYFRACERCEHQIVLTAAAKGLLTLAGLRYEKKQSGGHGRCLRADVPALGLRRGDRLEPSPALPDVSRFEELPADTGHAIVFWRPSEETLTRHRNPMFDADIGVTPNRSLTIDDLHCLYLGVFKIYAMTALWFLLTSGIFGDVGVAEENLMIALMVLRHALNEFSKARPELTRLHDLTPKMVGENSKRVLKTKAMETWTVLLFVVEQLRIHADRLPEGHLRLAEAGEALRSIVEVFRVNGVIVPPDQVQRCFELYGRYISLMEPDDILTPKNHLVWHMLSRIAFQGNPRFYGTWRDEGLNKTLKKSCRETSQATFERSILMRMRLILRDSFVCRKRARSRSRG